MIIDYRETLAREGYWERPPHEGHLISRQSFLSRLQMLLF
jgi:hypothetical protein